MTDSEPSFDPDTAQAARDWIMRLASGGITEAELFAYRRWASDPVHEAVFQHELALWRSLGALDERLAPTEPFAVHAGWRSHIRKSVVAAAVAACLMILAVGPELLLRARADHHTDVAVQSLTLPDGTLAVLDAGSAIAVRYDDDQRLVELLRGRAWFDVIHDESKPFRVAAAGGLVEDVGTAFMVADDDARAEAEAVVSEGVIRVRSPGEGAPWLTLRAGQRAFWTAGGAPSRGSDMPVSRVAAWRDGEVLLDNATVRDAVREIGRYRTGPTFVAGDVDRLPRVTAIVRAQRPDEGLRALAASARLQIHYLTGGIAIVRPAS